MAEMEDDLDFGDLDDLDLGDDDLDMDLGDDSDDLGGDLSLDTDIISEDSAEDLDLGGLDDLPLDEDLSLDEALSDDVSSADDMDLGEDMDLGGDDMDLEEDLDLGSDDMDLEEDLDLGGDDMDLGEDLLSDDMGSDSDAEGDLVDPEDMSLEGDDFDLDDADEENGDETFDIDADDGLDMESELLDDPSVDDDATDPEEKEDEGVDLSSLEDELGLDGSEQVVAPEVEEIPDVESDDDLENELANIGNDEEDDLGDVVLDESMEVQDLDAEDNDVNDMVDLDDLIDATDDEDELEEDILSIDEDEIGTSTEEMIEVSGSEEFDEFDITDDIIESGPISDDAILLEDSSGGSSAGQFRKPEPVADAGFNADFETDTQPKEPVLGKSMLFNLPHQLTVQVGKASLKGADISSLTYGSVIELDRKVGDPVDIVLGDETIAKGEVVQINDEQLGVRITRINC